MIEEIFVRKGNINILESSSESQDAFLDFNNFFQLTSGKSLNTSLEFPKIKISRFNETILPHQLRYFENDLLFLNNKGLHSYSLLFALNELEKLRGREGIRKIFAFELKDITDELGQIIKSENRKALTDIKDFSSNKESFENSRKVLLSIIDALDKTGCLNELIKRENKNINEINKFLSPENRIANIDKESLIERVNALDMTKKDDVIEMLLYSRHFSNRLAHSFDDYIYTNLYMSAERQEDYEIKRKQRIKYVENDVRKALLEDFENDPDAEKNAIEMLLKCDLDYQKSKKEIQVLEQEQDKNLNKIETRKNSLRKKEESYLAEIQNLKTLKIHNPRKAEDKIKEILSKINSTRIKKYSTKEEYTKEIVKEFIEILDDYKKAIIKQKGCSFEECPSYGEFIRKVIYEEDLDMLSSLEASKNGVPYNILERMNSFIDECKDEGVFYNIEIRMLEMANQYDFRENAYNLKHNNTIILLNMLRDNQGSIYMEQTPCRENKNGKILEGVTDFFIENSMQIFGAHFKPDEPEARISGVQTCPNVPKEIDEIFSFAKSKMTLHTSIPMAKITSGQKEEFKKLIETILYLESNREDHDKEDELLKLEELRELKNDKRTKDTYQILKVKFLLGAGLDKYRSYYLNQRNEGEIIRYFHDRKSDNSFAKEMMRLGILAPYSSYEESVKEVARVQRKRKKEDKEQDIN